MNCMLAKMKKWSTLSICLKHLLPFLKRFNDEQVIEMEMEALGDKVYSIFDVKLLELVRCRGFGKR